MDLFDSTPPPEDCDCSSSQSSTVVEQDQVEGNISYTKIGFSI